MNNKKSYVYKITCKITGEFYFGSSFNTKRDWYWGSGRKIKERIAQYGKENFVKEILEEFDDRVEAHKVENQYIEKFRNDEKCLNERLEHHFGAYGEESRAKIGVVHRGKIVSDDTRTKMSTAQCGEKNHNFGKHFSKEHRTNISAALRGEKNPMYGKTFSEEHKAKIGAAKRGIFRGKHWRKNPVTGKREWYE